VPASETHCSMNHRASNISSLVAGRIRPVRKAPPGLRLHDNADSCDQGVLSHDQVQGLLARLHGVMSAAQAKSSPTSEEFLLIQACIDTAVDAIDLLLARTSPDGSMLSGELRAVGFFSMKTGGCHDVAKNSLDHIQQIIDRAISLFTESSQSPAIGEVAAANYSAVQTAAEDADLAEVIGRLTQLDVLSQTSSQFSRRPGRNQPDIFEILPR